VEQSVTLQPGQHAVVTLTLVSAGEAVTGPVNHASSGHARAAAARNTTGRTAARTERAVGWSLGAAGVVWLGVGTLYAVRSRSKDQQSDHECGEAGNPHYCSPKGLALNDQAIRAANVARVSFVIGGVAAAAGVVLLGISVAADARPARRGLRLTATVGDGAAGLGVRGRW
jgi:hypothetical protein